MNTTTAQASTSKTQHTSGNTITRPSPEQNKGVRPSIGTVMQGYLSACNSSNLRMLGHTTCDADKLLAAAYATAGHPRKDLALRVYRLRVTHNLMGWEHIVQELTAMLRHHLAAQERRGKKYRRAGHSAQVIADAVRQVLAWWHQPVCLECHGRGHPLIENTPLLDTTVICPSCEGTGLRPFEPEIPDSLQEGIRWLLAELDVLCSLIFHDMAQRLRG